MPGVLLLPKGRKGKVPGILYCHWHGGEYGGGKSELFESRHTPVAPGPELVRRGIVPDVLTDQTSAHDALNGYVPNGMPLADALALRREGRAHALRRGARTPQRPLRAR